MKNIKYLKLIAKENLNIESSIGMLPTLSFIQKIGISKAILKASGLKEGKAGKKQVALLILCILAIIDGTTNIRQIPHFIQKNRHLCFLLGFKELPKYDAIYKLLKRINKDNSFVKKIKAKMQDIIKKYYINDQEAIIADIDATYMETKKESGSLNYKNEKSISALLCHIGKEKIVWDFDLREGSSSPAYGISKIVNDFFAKTNDIKIQKLIRSDSAGYQGEVINICERKGGYFVIKVSEHYDFDQLVKDKAYTKYEDEKDCIYSTDLIHTMNNTDPFRVVGYTENYEGELFSRSGYIATNIGKEKAGYEIVKIYRKRATQEQSIEELKNESGFRYVPSKDKDINNIYGCLCILAYNIMVLIQYLMKSKGIDLDWEIMDKRFRIKTFRYYFIHLAGKIVKRSRQIIVYIAKIENKWWEALLSFWNSCFGFGFYYR